MAEQNVHSSMKKKTKKTALDISQDGQDIPKTSQEERDQSVYRYLLTCLTELFLLKNSKGNEQPNESSIANQWGQKDNRIFVRRVLRSVMPEYYPDEEAIAVPGLTLSKLVEILNGIQEYRAQKSLNAKDVDDLKTKPQSLTRVEKLRALRKFVELSIDERQQLQIEVNPNQVLIQKLLEDITDPIKGLDNKNIARLCKLTLNIYQSLRTNDLDSSVSENISWHDFIEEVVTKLLDEYFPTSSQLNNIVSELVDKVKREINRVEFQCGINQMRSLLADEIKLDKHQSNVLSKSFVKQLTQSVVENEILTDEFPIYLKYIEIENKQPLPLYIKQEEEQIGLLNLKLLEIDRNSNVDLNSEIVKSIDGLERQFAYKVKVHFYINPPHGYESRFPKEFEKQTKNSHGGSLNFYEEITGIGSPVSNILGAINRVLFWDIPVLKDYMPIANEVFCYEEVIGQSSHSPVWCKTVVRMCKRDDVEHSINENCTYDETSTNQELACGEYCGFDLLEVVAKSSLLARLRAIKQTGIDTKKYLTQLCHRIEELYIFRESKRLLNFYPFSLIAMEGKLEETIFANGMYRSKDAAFNFTETELGQPWSLVAYEAHLTIADGYLQEGLYRVGKKYLDVIEPHIEKKYLSDLEIAKYWLCQFRYHYLTDLDDSENTGSDRYQSIQNALLSLDSAEFYVKRRLHKYYKIGEFSQSNFHPFFYILSRVLAFRAKIYMYASTYTSRSGGRWESLLEPIRLLEQARIYAARDGSESYYAYWSAYQSWNYLTLAYLGDFERNSQISREACLDWAKRLIDHALLCYSSIGKECYQEIKDNGGKVTGIARPEPEEITSVSQQSGIISPKFYEQYGSVEVQVVPLIRELPINLSYGDTHYFQGYDPSNHVLSIDMSILKHPSSVSSETVYLFGTHSALLLFAIGMYELCGEQVSEELVQSKIAKALRIFTYSWAIAKDGTISHGEDNDRKFYLDRKFEQNHDKTGDSLVMGLYPHRLTDFADLGKIFAALCQAILLIHQSNQSNNESENSTAPITWDDVESLIDSLHDCCEPSSLKSREVLEQARYNGHFDSQFHKAKTYFAQLKQKRNIQTNSTKESIINIRDKLVKDIFKIMRGESDVKA
ncbi:MAG: HypX (modular protein) [Pseudanabaena frigida]|uniref:HypX (Modular protein) n=1 Tax=Pseudanabaena frigida TaxID=945775 RepID=A0A2W4VVD2_9CYAN|nr:MAG: HypX (modular protein) [Pseudanabaena frigida]